jgi:branched-chain amino acid transport system permease protein
VSQYDITVLTLIGIWVVLTVSLNILTGYAGQISLGHAAFFGIGAYASALLATRLEWPFMLAFLGAMLVSGVGGTLLGLPSLRVRHDFLVLVTIGINFVVVALFRYSAFFGGGMGIVGIPSPSLFGLRLAGTSLLLFVMAFAGVAIAVSWWIGRAWLGLGMRAMRNDEDAAQSVGVSVARFKIYAFAISAALAGGAGSIYAHFLGSLFPDHFGFPESVVILSMLVFGGMGTLAGPILGAVVLKAGPEYLRFIETYRFTIYGGLLVVMMLFQPMGLLGDRSALRRWLAHLFRREAPT